MERLTYIKCPHWWGHGRNPTPYSSRETFQTVCDRLGTIEDILGDEYDLERLRELLDADRDGRCMIAPVKPGEVAWCGFVQRNPVSGETKNIVYPVILKGWWTGLKCKESDPRLFLFGELHESEEAAEAALKGEHDESV